MEEQSARIFEIIRHYDLNALENHLKRTKAGDLLAVDEQGMHPIEFAVRHLTGTPEPNLRERLIQIFCLLITTARDHRLGEKATTCADGTLVTSLVFTLPNPEDAFRLLAALLGLNDAQCAQLLEFLHSPSLDRAESMAEFLPPDVLIRMVPYLSTQNNRNAALHLLPKIDLHALSGLSLSGTAKAELIQLAVRTDNAALIDALGPGAPSFSDYDNPLVKAIQEGKEDVALALLRIGMRPSPFRTLYGFMPVTMVIVEPVRMAMQKKLDRFVLECIRRGLIKDDTLIDCCTENSLLVDTLQNEPGLLDNIQLDWKHGNTLLSQAHMNSKIIVALWPALTSGYGVLDQEFLFRNRMAEETGRGQKAAPLVLNMSACTQMPAPDFQILIGDFIIESYGHCSPEFVKQLCAIGICPQFACDWCIDKAITIKNDKGEEVGKELPVRVIELCTAAFEGTLQFLGIIKEMAPCPYIRTLCLAALGDVVILAGKLTTALQANYLPIELRDLIQAIYDEAGALWAATTGTIMPSLLELTTIDVFASLGLNLVSGDNIDTLTSGQTQLSHLSDQTLRLITIIAMEYKRRGDWPNPLAAFAFVALLEMQDEDWSWLAEAYLGTAEIEDNE